jgi:hypothetical protein
MNGLVFSSRILNRPGNKLFYLLRRGARPGTTRDRNAHWDIRIFALGHRPITKPTPREYTNQEHPGNLGVLDKKSRKVAGPFDNLLIAFVCHFRSAFTG